MTERDRLSLRAFREGEAQLEAAERERQERPIREATAKALETHRKLHNLERDRIATQRDDAFYISPELANARMPFADATRFTSEQGQLFINRNSWFYNSPANRRAVLDYFDRNGCHVCDAVMWERAARRLAEFYLLPDEAPEPQPQQQPLPQPKESTPELEMFEGIDLSTGAPKAFTQYEVDRMDSETFRRTFRLSPNLRSVLSRW